MSDKELKEILATIKRLEKAGSIQEMFKTAPEISNDEKLKSSAPFISGYEGFDHMRDTDCLMAAQAINDMEKCMSKAKFYFEHHHKMYKDYKSRENEIKHPDILKFIKDYEQYYMVGGKYDRI